MRKDYRRNITEKTYKYLQVKDGAETKLLGGRNKRTINHQHMWNTSAGVASITTTKHYSIVRMKASFGALLGRAGSQHPTVRILPLWNCSLCCYAQDLRLGTRLAVSSG